MKQVERLNIALDDYISFDLNRKYILEGERRVYA